MQAHLSGSSVFGLWIGSIIQRTIHSFVPFIQQRQKPTVSLTWFFLQKPLGSFFKVTLRINILNHFKHVQWSLWDYQNRERETRTHKVCASFFWWGLNDVLQRCWNPHHIPEGRDSGLWNTVETGGAWVCHSHFPQKDTVQSQFPLFSVGESCV